MDLISRSELVKLLEDRKREHYENYESFRNYMGNRRLEHETEYEECKRILTIVTNQPTVEDVPVVHGEWKYYKKQGIAVCTNCSFERNLDDNFGKAIACPNCGADMRKKV